MRLVLAAAMSLVALALLPAASADEPARGLVAAYGFDEGSGGLVSDASGNGHVGTISGATWASGRHGGALSFNGTNASVDLGALGTFYQGGFTLEAWVQKENATRNDVAVVGTWTGSGGGGPMLWVDHVATHYQLTLNIGLSNYLDSSRNPTAGEWEHLAATFDGTTARFYVDGTEVANRTVSFSVGASNAWRIGAYENSPAGFFDGLVDDVRIYDRALAAAEIQDDMNQPVTSTTPPADTTPPTAPGALTATGGLGQIGLSWEAATDDVGIAKYNVHRSTTPGFTPSTANRIAQPTGTTYADSGLAAGTYYYKVQAEDAAGNLGASSSEASATVTADTTPPTVAITFPNAGTTVAGTVTVTAEAADNQAVAGVQFKLDGQNLVVEDTDSPYSVAWDTSGEVNGSHTLTAVARDSAGNTASSAATAVIVSNAGVSAVGLRAAYGFDEDAGAIALDSSGNGMTAAVVGASWTSAGRFGGAVSLGGTSSEVDPPALGAFYKTGFTYEAWVFKQSAKVDVAVVGSWVGSQSGGAIIWVDYATGRYRLTLGNNIGNYLDSGRVPALGRWQHVAATYDGSVARFYVDGAETAATSFSGNVGDSNAWKLGAYGTPSTGYFDGLIDNVRIYDRALTASEIETDMVSRIQPDRTPPQVTSFTPASAAIAVSAGSSLTAKFNEPMQAATITASTFKLKDQANHVVPASVSYNQSTKVATLKPQSALQFAAVYRGVLEVGGVRDLAGNALASEVTWSFTTESRTPVLVVTSAANPFSSYLAEILRNEGLNSFTTIDTSLVTGAFLNGFEVVLLGDISQSTAQASTLTSWVNSGGNLIAMRPDKKLAALLGLTDAKSTLANAYLKVDTSGPPGAGIVGSTIQFHGTADRYTLNGATAVATLYSNATTATVNPAVTLRAVGTSGGQAAAFTFDLARSGVYTRQGNPAWAGQERDGVSGIRSDDLFYGAKVGAKQPDWVDTSRIAIPQADEQQRLLVNLITLMDADKMPLPRFWYLPQGKKAVVLLSGDDHSPSYAPGGTASIFDRLLALSPPGCVVAKWECVRATSYLFPDSLLSNGQAALYVGDGFEVALHPVAGSCPTSAISQSELAAVYDTQLAQFRARYTSVPLPVSSRTHCVFWPDWDSNAKVELARGIRMDANYYHFPGSWIGTKPGFLNGGGFPMRFADLDGTLVDVYQQNTNLSDETTQAFATTIAALLDNALGPQGFYGAFGTNIHTDNPAPQPGYEQVVAEAQARGVPLISYKQMLDWVDGRNSSTIRGLSWNAGMLAFTTTIGAGGNGLQTMLPAQGPTGTLSSVSCSGSPVAYTLQTIKGIPYAMFDAVTGTCQATYS
jgi:concanavalin A-like lectin/glucanase superfamily protein/Big-like domain-containing protein